jgi:hypothetical protein
MQFLLFFIIAIVCLYKFQAVVFQWHSHLEMNDTAPAGLLRDKPENTGGQFFLFFI